MTAGATFRLVVVMGLWAACFPLITIGLDLAPHLAFAALRAALAGMCLLALGAALRRPLPQGGRSWGLVGAVALGATSLGFLGMFHAAEFVSPGLATVVSNTQPLFAAVLAYTLLGERLRALGKIGLLTGFTGIAAIAGPGLVSGDIQGYALGIAYVVLAAIGVATGNVAIKHLAGRVDPVMAMGLQLLLGAAPLAILSILTEDVSATIWSADFIVLLLVLSVFGTSLAFWLWFTVLEEVELSRANAFTFLVPVFGIAIGAAFFEERLGWSQLAGVIVILAGIALVQRDERTAACSDEFATGAGTSDRR